MIVFIALTFYGLIRYIKLESYDDTDIMISQWDSFYNASHVQSEDLMFAFGITVYDSNPDPIEDPSIGVLKPYYKTWGIFEGGGVHFEEIETRNCTKAELHIDGESDPDSAFFQPHESSVSDLSFYYRKLKCIKRDTLEIQGDYNSLTTRSFVLLFEKCSNATFAGVCKSEEEISVWLRRKFVIINWNAIRFSTRTFNDTKIVDETRLIYVPVDSQLR